MSDNYIMPVTEMTADNALYEIGEYCGESQHTFHPCGCFSELIFDLRNVSIFTLMVTVMQSAN